MTSIIHVKEPYLTTKLRITREKFDHLGMPYFQIFLAGCVFLDKIILRPHINRREYSSLRKYENDEKNVWTSREQFAERNLAIVLRDG